MSTITFTTDFGMHEWYVGVMKGVIDNIDTSAKTIDITHEIQNHSVQQAAFVLAWSYSYFPLGTIHVVVVDPGVGSNREPILLESRGHFFIGPNNGVFTLVDHPNAKSHTLDKKGFWLPHVSDTFHGRDIFAPVAAYLARGTNPYQLGTPRKEPIVTIEIPKSKQLPDGTIGAEIIHVDRFGDCLTNIPNATLPHTQANKTFLVRCGEQDVSCIFTQSYDQAPAQQPMIIAGSCGFLELCLNKERFAELYKVRVGDPITVKIR